MQKSNVKNEQNFKNDHGSIRHETVHIGSDA